jgi:type IV fimbrial biogenesis protein FimT
MEFSSSYDNRRVQYSLGFSLVELVAALAVLAVATTLAVPSFASIVQASKSASARDQVMMMLYSARNTAVSRRQEVIVCAGSAIAGCTSNWSDGAIVFADVNRNRVLDGSESVVASLNDTELAGVALRGNRAFTRFNMQGRASGTNQTIRVCLPGSPNALSVVVSNSGRIRSGKTQCD